MQRRGGSGQPVKGQRTLRPKARKGPTAQVSAADPQEQLHRVIHERDEALEQLAATSEVLQVISSSPGKLEPVFQAMLENALRICEAKFGTLYLCDGGALRAVADTQRAPLAYKEARKRKPRLPPAPDGPVGRVLVTKQVVHIADLKALQSYHEHHPTVVDAVELAGFRTALGVPLMRDNELIGVINIMRQEVRPFSDKQIKLVENFAAQAVIAIENCRLLNELRQRTDDLTESLEQQTATSEVLQIISSSPGELEPVFNTMLQNAVQICDARFGNLALFDGRNVRVAAMHNAPPEFEKLRRKDPIVPLDRSLYGTLVRTKKRLHISDMTTEEPYASSALVKVAGARTTLAVPMLKEGELIGAINIYRQEVQPFTDKQVELLENFAAQAVIAIENTRLLNELRQRTDDLSESLEQQTATSEVLKVISSSPGELEPVFSKMLENAVRICEAKFGIMFGFNNGAFRALSSYGDSAGHSIGQPHVLSENPNNPLTRMAAAKETVHIADLTAERAYIERNPRVVRLVESAGARTLLDVPMLKDGGLIGAFVLYRQEVRPFTDKQIELVKNFAAQAVIAIENTRLLNELRQRTDDLSEALEQQTATSEVLKVISSSPGELEPVFQAMLANAQRICEAKFGFLYGIENGAPRIISKLGIPPGLAEYLQRGPHRPPLNRPSPLTAISRVVQSRQTVHITDYRVDPSYLDRDPLTVAAVELGGVRTLLAVPMLKNDEPIGAIAIYRLEVRPFTDKQIELVQNFAAQAVIAIENTRLLNELRQRTGDLSESLEQQTATSEVLKVISSSPGELEPVFQIVLENATRICEAKFGVLFRYENGAFYAAAMLNAPQAFVEFHRQRGSFTPPVGTPLDRLLNTGDTIYTADEASEPNPGAPAKFGGARSLVAVPMRKDNKLVGAIIIYRQEVRPFTDKQIELLTNFATQAVIAIENTGLLNELRESLQQQTATSDVLKVISRSTFDLSAVLNTLVESAVRLCDGYDSVILLREGEWLTFGAHHDADGFRQMAANEKLDCRTCGD
jgi:GAF domain-containing protein